MSGFCVEHGPFPGDVAPCPVCERTMLTKVSKFLSKQPREATEPVPSVLDIQEGGNHYKQMRIQPVEYIHANGIGYFEGCVIKYVSRWKNKNGLEDLRKARHFIDLLLELESKNADLDTQEGADPKAP